MSSPIRPPTGPRPSPSGVEGASETRAVDRTQVDGAAPASGAAPTASPAAAPAASSPTAAWLERLQAGEVTREQAIDGLLAEALRAHGGDALSPSHRAELEGVLRAALLDDPVLGGLLGAP